MKPDNPKHITIIGAGLAGALLAILLSRRGWQVHVFEKRGDPRIDGFEAGRSINLALAERGRHALQQAGAEEAVMAHAVMMRGRMVHVGLEDAQLQRYGRDDSEVIWSVNRGTLNACLLDMAEATGATICFNRRLDGVDFDARRARFHDLRSDTPHEVDFNALVGADGAGSQLRWEIDGHSPLGQRTDFLDHGYKELAIPPTADGSFRIEPHALHIWPRGAYMCIALPNEERSFTVTLFLPNEGLTSFATVRTADEAEAFFARDFPSALPLMPDLRRDWVRNPVGRLGTLTLERWHLDCRAVLIGDAAHAMVPFHGQGMNCAFEDCVALADLLQTQPDFERAFAAFQAERQPNAAAIQQMAMENYIEMRDLVDDAEFLLQRELESRLQQRHPDTFVPHYTMVTFMRIPYAVALERSEVQRDILVRATQGLASLDGIDWPAVDADVRARLAPLQARAA